MELEPVFAIITELVIIVIITDYEASVPIVRQVSTALLAASCMAFRKIHGCTNAFACSIHDSKDMVDSLHQLKRDTTIRLFGVLTWHFDVSSVLFMNSFGFLKPLDF